MQCDVCDSEIEANSGERITHDIFSFLLDNGFGLNPVKLNALIGAGLSAAVAEIALLEQHRQTETDRTLCASCASKAFALMAQKNEKWIDPNYIAVTHIAEEVGMGFNILGTPVALSRDVWSECVEWTDRDSEQQCYQEQEARMWDVMFTGGGTLNFAINQFMESRQHRFSVLCIPRDGKSVDSQKAQLSICIRELRGQNWLVIEKWIPSQDDLN